MKGLSVEPGETVVEPSGATDEGPPGAVVEALPPAPASHFAS